MKYECEKCGRSEDDFMIKAIDNGYDVYFQGIIRTVRSEFDLVRHLMEWIEDE